MDNLPEPTINAQRYAWIGYVFGGACMAALFITGLATGKPQLTVMASCLTVLLGVVWSSPAAAAKRATSSGRPAQRQA